MPIITAILIASLALAWTAATWFTVTPPNRKVVGIILAIIVIVWFLCMIAVIPGSIHLGR